MSPSTGGTIETRVSFRWISRSSRGPSEGVAKVLGDVRTNRALTQKANANFRRKTAQLQLIVQVQPAHILPGLTVEPLSHGPAPS